ncbi:VOC family protein [Jiangella alba]|uniref:Glyoxalase-like domain-containing protein n=1 Tax=Jiangella alba TaxID=561176 RepID=A0A1H5PM81_9ACTN|nr:VOC family protein [Jiangella alba]SEF14318.1 Glyoxalase-like domain-containing protein [Jiangella alba]
MTFEGSVNIAMKIPAAQYPDTVAFYRDVLGLPAKDVTGTDIAAGVTRSVRVEFGPSVLWLDEVPNYSRSDVWLELSTDDLPAAMERLAAAGATARDELEPLPDAMRAHWIANPAGVVHLVAQA